jgi:hypothetical protein
MTYQEYLSRALDRRVLRCPEERSGQAHFNVLYEMRPDLSERIRATTLDPFYNDGLLPDFLVWVRDNW